MENESLTQQGFQELLKEINYCLDCLDQSQKDLIDALVKISPAFNLKNNSFFLEPGFETAWNAWKLGFEKYLNFLHQAELAYQDLSQQMQSVLVGRNTQDPLYQEIARQGGLLLKDLQKRQDLMKQWLELDPVLSRIVQQGKMTPQQKQKIEDLVFRLQLLF